VAWNRQPHGQATFMRVLYVLAILFLACEASATAAPAYAPSELSLSDVLKKHDLAVGVGTVDAPGRSEEWTLNSSGMTGTEHGVHRGKEYRETLTLGPSLTQRGSYQGDEWEQGENGYTLHRSGYHQRTAVNECALADPSAPESHVSLLGRTESPVNRRQERRLLRCAHVSSARFKISSRGSKRR